MRLIGIDWSTNPKKVGLAVARTGDRVVLDSVSLGESSALLIDVVSGWLEGAEAALIAIDSPLGWPSSFGINLVDHRAGDGLRGEADDLFHRETDRIIHEQIGIKPLEVGADRIARTARSALGFLDDLRATSGHALPLAWDPHVIAEPSVIEAYPAATLKSHGLRHRGYKRVAHGPERLEIVEGLRRLVDVGEHVDLCATADDALDAVICAVAATDCLAGTAIPPTDLDLARQEGWIWVRGPSI